MSGCVMMLEHAPGSMRAFQGLLSGSGIEVLTVTPGLFNQNNPEVVANMDALIIDGQAGTQPVEHAIHSAALYGVPRLLRLVGASNLHAWHERFDRVRVARPRDAFSATVLTSRMARSLVAPNPVEWPPTGRMARVLAWQCCSKLIAIEDTDHSCWRVMMPNGKMQRFMLDAGVVPDQVPDQALAALTLQRVISKSWHVRSMQRWASSLAASC